jgi:hypothetical protein
LRLALAGGGVAGVGTSVAILAVFAGILLPIGLVTVTKAAQRARREGSLVVY